MNKDIYTCPVTGKKLNLFVQQKENGIIKKGYYQNEENMKYFIKDGIPDFTHPKKLTKMQKEQFLYYENNAEVYDHLQGLTFKIQNENESSIRKKMISYLHLNDNSRVLELSCGTGRDSENIAALLNDEGELFVQDLSSAMIKQCKNKLKHHTVPINYSVGNACYLPFPNNYFDAVFSFGGLNVFPDIKRSFKEMVRVTKPNGRILVGDESMPIWLYETEFGKILLDNNPLLRFKVPFEAIPIEARDVTVRWIIGGIYYLISFRVGEGEPMGNFDIEIPGKRGGTLHTRYRGKLEGVTEETKQLVAQAAKNSNMSIHQWLDQVLQSAAKTQIEQ